MLTASTPSATVVTIGVRVAAGRGTVAAFLPRMCVMDAGRTGRA